MTKRTVATFIAAAALLLASGWYAYFRTPAAPEMATATVRLGDIEQTVMATGKLRPKELVNVGAQVSGQVQRLYVTLGQRVRAGEPIADIDPRQQQLALQNAQAAVDLLRAQQAARRAALVQAELALQRQQTMLAQDATARADVEAARATLASVRGELGAIDAQIVQARIQVDTARINLGFTRIVAPMDGVVVAVVTKQGQTLNAFQSAPTIVMLARLDTMTVRAEISEADVDKVRVGQPVRFATLGAPSRRYFARIERVEPAPDSIATEQNAAQTGAGNGTATPTAIYYNALFDVPNPEHRLRPSMTAQVSVILARAKNAVIVPVAALDDADGRGHDSVRVLGADGRPLLRRIRTGISDGNNIVVLSGLKVGETVVIAQAAPADPNAGGAVADMTSGF